MLRLLSRVIVVAALASTLVLGLALTQVLAKDTTAAQESKKYRLVIFPSRSLGRLYDIRPGVDWVKVKNVYDKFVGTAANRVEVPQSARLALELDATVVNEPKLLESLAPDALFSLRIRNSEPKDNLLPAVCHLTGLRRLDLLDCTFTDKAVSSLVCLSQLERLTIGSCGLNGSCFKDLVKLKKLKYLNACNNGLN